MGKKNATILLVLLVFVLVLTGCGSGNKNLSKKSKDPFPNPTITSYGNKELGNYYYVVDERTGVVYISYDSFRRHSMTPALNTDGTPVTKDQLLKEEKGNNN